MEADVGSMSDKWVAFFTKISLVRKKGQFPLEKNQTPLYEINLKSLETQTHLCTVLKMAMCIIPLELESQAKSHPSPLSND